MTDIRLGRPIRLFAPAKVNLGLEVVRKRADGFHEIVTILQTISLFDEILLTPSSRLDYEGDPRIPVKEDLALQAISLFGERLGMSLRASVQIEKHIPIGAGLGGGSSDAATLLATLCVLGGIDLAIGEEIAAELGSDVPFFVRGGIALATGTGTTLEPLPAHPRMWFVLAAPDVGIPRKTASLYASLRDDDFSDGEATRAIAADLQRRNPIDPDLMRNSFAKALYQIPEVNRAKQTMLDAGARLVLPCGAGPSLFTLSASCDEALALANRLRFAGLTAIACTNVSTGINAARVRRLPRR